jgi:hypothetical protein
MLDADYDVPSRKERSAWRGTFKAHVSLNLFNTGIDLARYITISTNVDQS